MGTTETTGALQEQIKALAVQVGWSQNKLARIIFVELNENDCDVDIRAFQERFKKELQRNTTKVERLKQYLSIMTAHPDVEKIGLIHNRYISSGHISAELEQTMRAISREIDIELEKSLSQ